ncbi:MAG: exodeoxyribonuclease VII small subunit [Calditrichia bacterium]
MKKGLTFEKAMSRLEEIAGDLEKGEAGIEESLKMYEEGVLLIEFCQKKLNEAEKKVQKLSRTAEGKFELTELDGEDLSESTD